MEKSEKCVTKHKSRHGVHNERAQVYSVTDFDTSPIRGAFYASLTDGENPVVKSIVYQIELCPKTKHPHFQMLLIFPNAISVKSTGPLLAYPEGYICPDGVSRKWPHIEKAYKLKALQRYVQKPESRLSGPYVLGVPVPQMDSIAVAEEKKQIVQEVKEGCSAEEIICRHPAKFLGTSCNNLKALVNAHRKYRDYPQAVIALCGLARAGKNTIAECICQYMGNYSVQDPGEPFWDDVQYGLPLILEELEGQMSFKRFKILMESKNVSVRQKNCGRTPFAPPLIFITSEKPLKDWFPQSSYDSIRGRITVLKEGIEPYIRNHNGKRQRYWSDPPRFEDIEEKKK